MASTSSKQHFRAPTTQRALSDAAYAAVGLGSAVAGTVRTLPGKLSGVRVAPGSVNSELRKLRDRAEREFLTLADRGRTVVDATRGDRASAEAAGQVRTARSQVRAASTSVRNATKASARAVESSATTARKAADRDQLEAMTVEQLRDLATRMQIEGRSGMNKHELVRALTSAS